MEALPETYGALLLGALFASGFSGIVSVQSIVYFKLFPRDKPYLKALVLSVWSLDLAHTALVWSALWEYMITNFGNSRHADYIPFSIALSVVLTATLTFLAHCFFAHRIYRLSQRNLYLSVPIIILAIGRLASASVSGGEMVHLRSYTLFRRDFRWLFSMGLALSSGVDILITVLLFLLLQNSRTQSMSLDHIIDSLVLYTFEIGSLTSLATVVSMICWIRLDNSLIFLGLHFVIGKLYANSLLATLNTREQLRRNHSTAVDLMNVNLPRQAIPSIQFLNPQSSALIDLRSQVQVNVSKSIQYDDT
ncbi:hypothetical protein B0H34DRAFT_7362 [Crassisporium funariophilum]|nr:hypothetical protein B0H34DRAFT_7362 [Crassisporium funariophilum]